jgi:hypothetical protein
MNMPQKGLMAPVVPESAEAMPDGDEGGAPTEQATPQEAAQFDALMKPVTEAIHGKGSAATLAKLKAGGQDLATTIGEMAAQMILAVTLEIKKSGGEVSDTIKFQVGQEIVIDLIEVAEAAALIPDEDDEIKGELFKNSMLNAIGSYGDEAAKAGLIDREQAKQDLTGMVQNNDHPIAKNVAAMLSQRGGQ